MIFGLPSRRASRLDRLGFLKREGRFKNAPRPKLILLDLHLPRMSREEVYYRDRSARQPT